MKLKTYYLTKNDCYKATQPLTPKGIIVHSTGVRPDRALTKAN